MRDSQRGTDPSPEYADPVCICEHEPHDGECPERVRTVGGTMECGCDEYCPARDGADDRISEFDAPTEQR